MKSIRENQAAERRQMVIQKTHALADVLTCQNI